MLQVTRTVRFAIIGFIAVAALVLGGLGWATVASLRLEKATQETQAAQRRTVAQKEWDSHLEIARLLVEREISPLLMREVSKGYDEYAPRINGEEEAREDADPDPSETDSETPEPWILVHFQVTEDRCWTSPELTTRQRRVRDTAPSHHGPEDQIHITCAEADASDPEAVERQYFLEQLALRYTPEDIAARILAATQGTPVGGGTGWEFGSPQRPLSLTARVQAHFLPPPLECETARQVQKVTRGVDAPAGEPEEVVQVRVNSMIGIELPLVDDHMPNTAFVRQVDIGADRVFQGFLVDFARMWTDLAVQHPTFLGGMGFEPATTPPEPDRPSTQLVMLPIRLVITDPKVPATTGSTSLVGVTVAFAWVTALAALAAIGLGVKRLVSLSERRREFTYAVTHELRTPLTTFQLYTDMLAAGLVSEEKKAHYLTTLNVESQRLASLITEVLEYSRVESDAVHARMGTHRAGELLAAVRDRYESRCQAAGMALVIDTDGTADHMLHTDPHLALQILGTLIDNACKYAPAVKRGSNEHDRGVPDDNPTVRLYVVESGSKVSIEVADNGPGIAAKDRSDMFAPFRRGAHPDAASTGGVGLGLALAKRWTRLIRGNLDYVERPGITGACFRLTLPGNP